MLEATQTGPSQILFKAGRQWEDRVVGNFRLRQYLGSTDHSAVFLTELGGDQGQKAAIKLIAADPTTADIQLDRWRLAAKLSHPRLLQIFEVGKCQISGDDLLFIVMEYASENLSQILPERSLSDAEARDMLKAALEALAYLHENGFAHGRIKPANIMAVGEQVKLCSDGICRAGIRAPAALKPGIYDPPEIDQEGLSTAGDVWSLGITLVEAVTQRFPIWENRLVEEPTVPDSVRDPFLTITHNCLLRDPRRRWTISPISTCLEPPAAAVSPIREVKSRPKQEKPKQEKSAKDLSTRIFAGAMVAAVLIALLVANLLRHHSHSTLGNAAISQAQNDSDAPITTVPVVQEHIVNQPLPAVPERALRTIRGKVKVIVRVHVDPSGKVATTEFQNRGPSRYFAERALQAAQTWKFAPAQTGQRWRTWVLQFVFERSGVTVHPRQVA